MAEQSVARRAADRAFPQVKVTRGGRVNATVMPLNLGLKFNAHN